MTNTARQDELDLCHYNDVVSAYTSTCYTFLMMERFVKVTESTSKYLIISLAEFEKKIEMNEENII